MLFPQRDLNDSKLVRNVLNGKTEHFAILVDRYENLVFSTLFAKLNQFDDAEDLAQETFLKAFQSLKTLEDPGKFGSWLKSISDNLANDFLASQSVRQRDLSQAVELPRMERPDEELDVREKHERLLAEIKNLKPEHREVILLYYFEGAPSLQKMADFLGLPSSTVRGRVERARIELRNRLEQDLKSAVSSRRLGRDFTRGVMALLSSTLWHLKRPVIPKGLAWKIATGLVVLSGIGVLEHVGSNWVERWGLRYFQVFPLEEKNRQVFKVHFAPLEERRRIRQQIHDFDPELTEKGDTSDASGIRAPSANLIYTGQEGPQSEYTVTGFFGAASPGNQIVCFFDDGSDEETVVADRDGSFEFRIPYERGQPGFSIRTKDVHGELSNAIRPRLDYPLMGGMGRKANERGWFNITFASTPEEENRKAWDEFIRAPSGRRSPTPYRGDLPEGRPEDYKVYGYTPDGELVTCILGASGLSFLTQVREDGRFTLIIPHEAVKKGINGLTTFIINVSDSENNLLAATGISPSIMQQTGP